MAHLNTNQYPPDTPTIGCQRTSSGLLFTDADMVEESGKIVDPEPQEVPKWMETVRLRGWDHLMGW